MFLKYYDLEFLMVRGTLASFRNKEKENITKCKEDPSGNENLLPFLPPRKTVTILMGDLSARISPIFHTSPWAQIKSC